MDFLKIAGVSQHIEFFKFLSEILFKKQEREEFYRRILAENTDVSVDTFKEYFEQYMAERKSKQQDFTPESISKITSIITQENERKAGWSAYDITSGTGSLIISKWWEDMTHETPLTYAPHRYLYRADELSDTALPFLLHNLAIRGMNCVVVHGDVLERTAKNIYFIQNSDDDYLHFSDINVFPRTVAFKDYFQISEYIGDPIEHIESGLVKMNFAFPSIKKFYTETKN